MLGVHQNYCEVVLIVDRVCTPILFLYYKKTKTSSQLKNKLFFSLQVLRVQTGYSGGVPCIHVCAVICHCWVEDSSRAIAWEWGYIFWHWQIPGIHQLPSVDSLESCLCHGWEDNFLFLSSTRGATTYPAQILFLPLSFFYVFLSNNRNTNPTHILHWTESLLLHMFSPQLLPVVLSGLDLLIVLPDAYNISKLHIVLPSLSLSLLFTTASFMFFSYLLLLYALNTVFTVGLEKWIVFLSFFFGVSC